MIDHKGRCQGRPCTCGAKQAKANLLRSQAMMGNQNARKHLKAGPEVNISPQMELQEDLRATRTEVVAKPYTWQPCDCVNAPEGSPDCQFCDYQP